MEDDLVQLRLGQTRLEGEMALLRTQQTLNHQQNRNSIHDMRDSLQTFVDRVGMVEQDLVNVKIVIAKIWGYAAGAGAVVAVVVKLIDHFWK